MLMVKARAGISQIHGIGLIVREFIPKGACVQRFQPGFDQVIGEENFSLLPLVAQQFVHYYAYYDAQKGGYVLCADDDRFTNHSNEPNTQNMYAEDGSFATYAIRDIQVGEEITWNYRGWVNHDFLVSNELLPPTSQGWLNVSIGWNLFMLLVKAKAGISPIHGIGLMAQEFIACGTSVWRFEPGFDMVFTAAQLSALPAMAREQVVWYAYFDPAKNLYVLSSDDDRFTNHSDYPNTADEVHQTFAASYAIRDIEPGEEITWDYRAWSGTDFRSNSRIAQPCSQTGGSKF